MQQYTAEERERARRMALEVQEMRLRPPLTVRVDIDAFDLFRVIGSLQLAWRHPGMTDDTRGAVERFTRQLQGAFPADEAPETARTLEQGWSTEFDR